MAQVADYSWARPDPNKLRAHGFIGVIRYLGPGNRGRDVTRSEANRLHASGLGLGLVWETTTTAALAGFEAGWCDAEAANHWADSVGAPDELPLFIAVDTDVTPEQIRRDVAGTFRGALQVSKRPIRPYGEADVLDILCGELGLMPCGWQCAAWSTGRYSRHRCLYQRWPPVLDGQVDANDLGPMPTDFLWHPTLKWDAPHTPTAVTTTGEDWLTMATRDDVKAAMREVCEEVLAQWHKDDRTVILDGVLRGNVIVLNEVRQLLEPLAEAENVLLPEISVND